MGGGWRVEVGLSASWIVRCRMGLIYQNTFPPPVTVNLTFCFILMLGFGFQMFLFLLKVIGFMKLLRENLPDYVFTVVRPRPDIYELAFDRT